MLNRLLPIENLVGLLEIRLQIFLDDRFRQHRAFGLLIARIPDHAGEVPDDEMHLAPEVLKVTEFPPSDRTPEMDSRTRRVDTELHAEFLAGKQALAELIPADHLRHAAGKQPVDFLFEFGHIF